MIRPFLSSITDKHKDGRKIQLTAEITFGAVGEGSENSEQDSENLEKKDPKEPSTIHIHGENSEVYIGYETTKIVEELFKSLLREYQTALETKMKKNDLNFDSVDALYYKLHKIS